MDRGADGAQASWRFPAAVGLVLLAVLGVAHIVNIGVFEDNSGDYGWYYRPVAERLVDGDGLTGADGEAAVRYPPGYPLLLAAAIGAGRVVGVGSATSAVAASLVLAVGCGVLLASIARALFGRTVAIASVAVWATYPLNLYVLTQPGSEVPFLLLLLVAVRLLLPVLDGRTASWRTMAAVGAVLGVASLVRPVGPVALVAVAVAVALRTDLARRVRVQQVAVAAAALVVVVAPWTIWASAQTGDLVPLSTGGPPSMADGLRLGAGDPDTAGRVPMPASSRAVTEAATEAPLGSTTEIASFVGEQVQERPGGVAGLLAVKAARSWYGTEAVRNDGLVALVQAAYLLLIGVALARVGRRAGATGRRFSWFAAALLAVSWLVTALVLPLFWYVMPAINVALIAAGAVPVAVAARLMPGRVSDPLAAPLPPG